jgi:aminoglycoside phosphotransferase (APT) family kinase protein
VGGASAETDERHEALGRYLSDLLGRPLTVRALERIEGGWSRQTHRVVVTEGQGAEQLLALRGEIDNSVLDTDLEREWHILRSVAGSGIPLPAVHGFEGTREVLGHRFITTGWAAGTGVNPWRIGPSERAAWEASRDALSEQWINDIAQLHGLSPDRMWDNGIDRGVDAGTYVKSEVAHWTGILRTATHHAGYLVDEACRWMETNMPSLDGDASIVHGDLRIGNMLVDGRRVVAFLDWEMAAVGDWRADIGYSLMPYHAGKFLKPVEPSWNHLMAPRAFIERYAAVSGRELSDADAVFFIVLGCMKMIAILCTGIDAYMDGRNNDPRLAWLSLAIPGLVHDAFELIDGGLPW